MVNTGDTAWVLASASLVLLMTPGLALFYGGMVRAKSALNMMMMSFGALGLISVLWVLYGYSLAFGDDVGGGLLGSPTEFLGLGSLLEDTTTEAGGLPAMAFVGFQAVFAIITVALVSGAVAERMKFGGWLVFAGVWATVVYFPVAHWVFDFSAGDHVGGWIANTLGAIDFAGGTAVHINAGAAALALALVLGTRRGFGTEAMRPHNLPLVMLGAGLLWFGWFGFNAGSALAANHTAAVAWVNTLVAPAAASLAWILVERVRRRDVPLFLLESARPPQVRAPARERRLAVRAVEAIVLHVIHARVPRPFVIAPHEIEHAVGVEIREREARGALGRELRCPEVRAAHDLRGDELEMRRRLRLRDEDVVEAPASAHRLIDQEVRAPIAVVVERGNVPWSEEPRRIVEVRPFDRRAAASICVHEPAVPARIGVGGRRDDVREAISVTSARVQLYRGSSLFVGTWGQSVLASNPPWAPPSLQPNRVAGLHCPRSPPAHSSTFTSKERPVTGSWS